MWVRKHAIMVLPVDLAKALVNRHALVIDKEAVIVAYYPEWTPEQVAEVVRAAVGHAKSD